MKQPWRVFGVVSLAVTICLAAALGLRAPAAQAQGTCVELVQNGGFENTDTWFLGTAPQMPEYVTYTKHSGSRSLAMGITKGASQKSYSSARQVMTIPSTANTITLSFWFNAMMGDPIRGQNMELVLMAPNGAVLEKPWRSQNDSRTWNQMSFDLSRWRGRTLQVYFNVYNDGQGGTAGMFLDDVSLVACSSGTTTPAASATPTPTRTPTPGVPVWTVTTTPYYVTPTAGPIVATPTWTPYYLTPTTGPIIATATWTPSGAPIAKTATSVPPMPVLPTTIPWPVTPWPGNCIDVAKNGAFEYGLAGWHPSANTLPIRIVGSPAFSPPNALQLGTQSQQAKSYSSVRQYVAIPAGNQATLQFWTWTWSEPNAGADRQEAILLAPNNAVIAILWRTLRNDQAWRQVAVDLTPYAGRTVAIYFNVSNDGAGGRTAMFLDSVQLLSCGTSGPPPGPVTVLPPMTIGTPVVLRELPDTTVLSAATLSTVPAMTRIALDLAAPVSPTPRASATATATPTPTPMPRPSLLQQAWDDLRAQISLLACLVGLVIFAVIVALIVMYFPRNP
jgi:hypothetical protein